MPLFDDLRSHLQVHHYGKACAVKRDALLAVVRGWGYAIGDRDLREAYAEAGAISGPGGIAWPASWQEVEECARKAIGVIRMTDLELGVANINRLWPKIPMTVYNQGWVYGMWYCGKRFKARKLYGEYPGNFLARALAIFPNAQDILHCPCGTVTGPGVTVDVKREGNVQPQIIADAASLPFADKSFDLVLSDPPYSEADSKKYGCEKFPMGKFMNEGWRVLKHGGHIGMLHVYYPMFRRHLWKMVGAVGVLTGFQRQVRIFSIFEKINGNQKSLFR